MDKEYIIISKTAIQKRIEDCDKHISILYRVAHSQLGEDLVITNIAIAKLYAEKDTLNLLLSQSIPLIPEIEKAVTEGVNSIHFENDGSHWRDENVVEDYISNLKLDI